jgi:hypothetical protein
MAEIPSSDPFQRNYLVFDFKKTEPVQQKNQNASPKQPEQNQTPQQIPNCAVTYTSLEQVTKLNNPLIVCKLDLSKAVLTSIPKVLYTFTNMQQLDFGYTLIKQIEINQLMKALPKCNIKYQIKQADSPVQQNSSSNNIYLRKTGTVICIAPKLAVRKSPSAKGEVIGTITEGFLLKYVDVVTNGEMYNGNSTWYKDADGNYYWGGGFIEYSSYKKLKNPL